MREIFFALLRAGAFNAPISASVKNGVTPENLPALYKLGKRYEIAHLIGEALQNNGLLTDGSDAQKRFMKERSGVIFRYGQMQYEIEQISAVFRENHIPFVLLKGAVIRSLYPEPWMRTSCDVDVLVRKENLDDGVRLLQEKLGYRYERTGNHDVTLFAESGVHLELHYRLGSRRDKWNDVLAKVWDFIELDENGEYRLSKEMFYFYHIAHMAGHFQFGGCGIRTFLDLQLLRKNNSYDEELLTRLLQEGGLLTFHNAVCQVANCWFGEGTRTELVENVEEYVLSGGLYGDMANRVALYSEKQGGRWKFLKTRIFLSYEKMQFQYPILQKHKWLLPLYQVKRWFRLLKKENRQRSVEELRETVAGDENKKRLGKLMKELDV